MVLATRNAEKNLLKNYQTPGHPTFSAGLRTLKKFYPQLSLEKIKQLLSQGDDSYSLHREFKKVKRFNPIFVYGRRELMQIDLADVSALAATNRGTKYLLTAIDSFTRKAWVRPLKNKSSSAVLEAFLSILKAMQTLPKRLLCDQGKEFVNASFKSALESRNIRMIHLYSEQKAAHVERFNRTLKRLIYSLMTQRKNRTYIDRLPDIVRSYNGREHRIIKMTPEDADKPANRTRVLYSVMDDYGRRKREIRKRSTRLLEEGQWVRIHKFKGKFGRGFHTSFTSEKFKIVRVDTRKPAVLYHLQDRQGEPVQGGFYRNELQLVYQDDDDDNEQ